MHVAIVSPYDPRPRARDDPLAVRGGVEEALDRCAAGLAARGHEVTLVCSTADAAEAGVETDADGVRLVRVRRRGVFFRDPVAPLARHVPDDADVVHVPATYPFHSDLLPLRERRRGRACVLDYHFDVHGTSPAMQAASWMHRGTLGRGMFAATRIACKSRDYARHSPVLQRVADRLDWVPNGVDVDEFRADAARGDDILCVGRLVPYKGVATLMRAMPAVHEETGARLVVAGDGPEAPRLQRLSRELDAPVAFLGRVDRARLRALYASARVSVLPSVNSQEAFGITLLESMASGTPVVASDLPGVREIATLAGTVAPPGDVDALAAQVASVWTAPRAFGTPEEIRQRVAERYAWRAVVARLEAVYERAVADAAALKRAGAPWRLTRPARAGGG